MDVVAKMDEGGRFAWIIAIVVGFIVFWPAGLAILAYTIWTGRIGHMHHRGQYAEGHQDWRAMREKWREEKRALREEWRERKQAMKQEFREYCGDMKQHWKNAPAPNAGQRGHPYRGNPVNRPSGNAAFDEYKLDTIRRLEEEQQEFQDFLENLRKSKDKVEFDQFMADRRTKAADDARDVTPHQDGNSGGNGNYQG